MNELINVEKFKENIGKAKELLNTYFPKLKEEYLQLEKDQDKIKQLNEVYIETIA